MDEAEERYRHMLWATRGPNTRRKTYADPSRFKFWVLSEVHKKRRQLREQEDRRLYDPTWRGGRYKKRK